MFNVHSYKQFESRNDIQHLCDSLHIENYQINADRSVDVNGDVRISHRPFRKIPIKFGKVSESFYCFNSNLRDLENSPQWVGGNFWVSNNKLKSLNGMPKHIGGSIDVTYNELTNFEGFPEYFDGQSIFHGNPVYEVFMLFWVPKAIHLINEMDVIQGKTIVLERLVEVYHQMKKSVPKEFHFTEYELV